MQAHAVSRPDADTFEVTLGRGARQVPMSIYRALVKIVVSIVDEEHLPELTKTIEWVRYAMHVDQPLPMVAMATIDLPAAPSAQITVYIRRAPHPRLPHIVGEFRLGCYVFAFAVPSRLRSSRTSSASSTTRTSRTRFATTWGPRSGRSGI